MVLNDGMKSIFLFCICYGLYYFDVYQTVYQEKRMKPFLHGFFYDSEAIMADSDAFKLATINLTEANVSDKKFHEVATELVTSLKKVGFVYVVGCKDYDPDELEKQTKWFFNLPVKTKMWLAKKSFRQENPNVYRGYLPNIPGEHSYKEGFELGVFNNNNVTRRYLTSNEVANQTENSAGRKYMRNILSENNVWPVTEDESSDDRFRRILQKQHKVFQSVGRVLVHLLAVGLGFEKTHFDHLFGPHNIASLRLVHYPTRLNRPEDIPDEAWDGEKAIVTGQQSSILTILSTFKNRGFQIKPPGHEKWLDVPVFKNRLIINVGDLLQELVENNIVARNYHILDIGIDRYSAAMFYGLKYDSPIEKTFYGNITKIAGSFKRYGPWMTNRTNMVAESATTDFGVDDA